MNQECIKPEQWSPLWLGQVRLLPAQARQLSWSMDHTCLGCVAFGAFGAAVPVHGTEWEFSTYVLSPQLPNGGCPGIYGWGRKRRRDLSEGKFNLKFLILTFGDIQNQSVVHSLAQALIFSGADLDLADMRGPPPATNASPCAQLFPVTSHCALLAHGSLWTEPCLCQLWAAAGCTFYSAWAHVESPSCVHSLSTCWAAKVQERGHSLRGTPTNELGGHIPQDRRHDRQQALVYSVS